MKAVVTIKHPYAWHVSVNRMANLKHKPLKGRIHGYNRIYTELVRYSKDNPGMCTMVRYIDLMENPEREVRRITGMCEYPLEKFNPIFNEALPSGDLSDKEFSRYDYYSNAHYMADLAPSDMAMISQGIDWDMLAEYGYTKEPPTLT